MNLVLSNDQMSVFGIRIIYTGSHLPTAHDWLVFISNVSLDDIYYFRVGEYAIRGPNRSFLVIGPYRYLEYFVSNKKRIYENIKKAITSKQ